MVSTRISYEIQYGKERSRREIAKRVVATYMARDYESHVFRYGREAKTEKELVEYILSSYGSWLEWVKATFTETEIQFMFSTPSEYKRNVNKKWFDVAASAAREAFTEMLLPLYRKQDYKQPTFCFA